MWWYLLACGNALTTGKSGLGPGESCVEEECSSSLVCSQEGVCVEPGEIGTRQEGEECSATAECAWELVCAGDHLCAEAGAPGTGGDGASCSADIDCQSGFSCEDGACVDLGIPVWEGGSCPDDDSSFYAVFEPPRLPVSGESDFFALPYPNNYRLDVYGRPELSGFPSPGELAPAVDVLLGAVSEKIDGFGVNPTVYFRFSQPVDPETVVGLTSDATVHFASLDPDASDYGELHAMSWTTRSTRGRYMCGNQVVISTFAGEPLQSGHDYGVWLTRGITNRDGDAAGRSDALNEVLGANRPSGLANGQIWDDYAPLRDYLASVGLTGESIVSATVFGTGASQTRTRALPDTLGAPTVNELASCEQDTSPCDDGAERVCARHDGMVELHARLVVPGYTGGDGAVLWEDGVNRPLSGATESACVVMTVPSGPTPAEGWPVVLYGGDVGGTFRDVVTSGVAARLAAEGVASLGIELPWHGARSRTGDTLTDYYAVYDPNVLLGSYVQTLADLYALETVVTDWSVDGAVSPTGQNIAFDDEQLWFIGHGQGGAAGTTYLAWSREVAGGVLANPAGGVTHQLIGQNEPVDLAHGLQSAFADADLSATHPLIGLLQTLLDSVDPVSAADGALAYPYVKARPIYLIYGVDDAELPAASIQALDLAFGAPTGGEVLLDYGQAQGSLPFTDNVDTDDGRITAGTRQFQSGHRVLEGEALDSAVAFVLSGLAGAPQIAE